MTLSDAYNGAEDLKFFNMLVKYQLILQQRTYIWKKKKGKYKCAKNKKD